MPHNRRGEEVTRVCAIVFHRGQDVWIYWASLLTARAVKVDHVLYIAGVGGGMKAAANVECNVGTAAFVRAVHRA